MKKWSWFYISAPADADSNIVTGAVDDMETIASAALTHCDGASSLPCGAGAGTIVAG